MNKDMFTSVRLEKGEMNIYNFGDIKLHAYKTNDFIDDEVFIVEKNQKGVIIEAPCFFDNYQELEKYLTDNGINVKGMLLSYHMAGGTFLKDVPKYATKNADVYGHNGGGKSLIDNFANAFGNAFDNKIHTITNYIECEKVSIADIDFVITQTSDAFDIQIPEINAVYTHMLGHDCHSIVASCQHADSIIKQLEEYISNGIDLVLTSHYTPEDLKDVQTKIDYLKDIKNISCGCKSAMDFKSKVKSSYPNYSGENYLDMTSGFLFN